MQNLNFFSVKTQIYIQDGPLKRCYLNISFTCNDIKYISYTSFMTTKDWYSVNNFLQVLFISVLINCSKWDTRRKKELMWFAFTVKVVKNFRASGNAKIKKRERTKTIAHARNTRTIVTKVNENPHISLT